MCILIVMTSASSEQVYRILNFCAHRQQQTMKQLSNVSWIVYQRYYS